MKLKFNDAILVKWIDIVQENGWHSEQDAGKLEPVVCRTLGFFVNETKRVIRLSDTLSSDGERNVTVIPKGVILKIRRWDRVRK
jgi:hypothetical protein